MINDLKEFEKFLKICRKQGVAKVTLNGVSVEMGDLPVKVGQEADESEVETPDELTGDNLIFYATQNHGSAVV